LDLAADANGLRRETFPDREFDQIAKARVGTEAAAVTRKISDLGCTIAPPWRADEKQAALAAWLVLHFPG